MRFGSNNPLNVRFIHIAGGHLVIRYPFEFVLVARMNFHNDERIGGIIPAFRDDNLLPYFQDVLPNCVR